jgi:glycosyl-4,4'-diaponeurosporenoate acyltransferase
MQVVFLSHTLTVLVDIAAWFIIHISFAWFVTQLPSGLFRPNRWPFRLWDWEGDASIYQKLFRVKQWKKKLPDGAALFKKGFRKKRLLTKDRAYLERYLQETCRGELVHWLVLMVSPLFFLWNPAYVGFIMIGYALLANLPCIVVQRYNRPYLQKLIDKESVKEQ